MSQSFNFSELQSFEIQIWLSELIQTQASPVVLNRQCESESPEGLVKTQTAELHPQSFSSVDPGKGPKICTSYKSPGDADATGWRMTL